MDEKCFLIIAIILGVLILIVLVVIMIYSITKVSHPLKH